MVPEAFFAPFSWYIYIVLVDVVGVGIYIHIIRTCYYYACILVFFRLLRVDLRRYTTAANPVLRPYIIVDYTLYHVLKNGLRSKGKNVKRKKRREHTRRKRRRQTQHVFVAASAVAAVRTCSSSRYTHACFAAAFGVLLLCSGDRPRCMVDFAAEAAAALVVVLVQKVCYLALAPSAHLRSSWCARCKGGGVLCVAWCTRRENIRSSSKTSAVLRTVQ